MTKGIPPPRTHIRIKRHKATYFVRVHMTTATLFDLCQGAARMMGVPADEVRVCQLGEDGRAHYLQEEVPLSELGLRNDAVVCAILRRNGIWETPNVIDYPQHVEAQVNGQQE